MKRLSYLILAAGIFLSLFGCKAPRPKVTEIPPPPSYASYVDEDGCFGFAYPVDWSIRASKGGNVFMGASGYEGNYPPSLSFIRSKREPNILKKPDDFLRLYEYPIRDAVLKEFQPRDPNITIQQMVCEDITIDGLPGKKIVYEYQVPDRYIQDRYVSITNVHLFVLTNDSYLISFEYESGADETVKAMFSTIQSTIKIQ